MKKLIASLVLMAMLLIALPVVADAQCSCRARRSSRSSRSYASQRYYAPARSSQPYYAQRQRSSFYRRHRNLINIGIASGAGALIGGVASGRRGALIGAGSGAGLGALYTYVLKAKKRRY